MGQLQDILYDNIIFFSQIYSYYASSLHSSGSI